MKNETHGGTAVAPRKTGDDDWTFDGFEVHPLARVAPVLPAAQMDALVDQVRRCGSPPVLKHGGVILGDHNVCRACQELGVAVAYVEWDGTGLLAEAVARSILAAAQFDPSKRAAIAVPISEQLRAEIQPRQLVGLRRGGGGNARQEIAKTAFPENPPVSAQCAETGNSKHNPNPGGECSARRAAELFQISESAVNQARHLWKEHPDLYSQLLQGGVNLSQARLQASKRKRAATLPTLQDVSRKRNQAGDDVLIVGDCRKEMGKLADASVDLIWTDPQYNNGWHYDADPYGDTLPDAEYLHATDQWIKGCVRLLKPTGSLFVLIDGRWQGRFDMLLRQAGLHWRNTIVWHDTFPNNTSGNFEPAARFIHYFVKSKTHYTWNGDAVREPSGRDLIGDKRRVHCLGVVFDNVWRVPRIVGTSPDRVPFEDSPPQVPALIVERCMLAASNPGDRVFDPFTGNGTTWRAARKLGRKFTGIERSSKYAEQARRWALGD